VITNLENIFTVGIIDIFLSDEYNWSHTKKISWLFQAFHSKKWYAGFN